jgi:hypothetical protein
MQSCDQLEHIMKQVADCQLGALAGAKFREDSDARYDEWRSDVACDDSCEWLNQDPEAEQHFLSYMSGYHSVMRSTALSATFKWEGASTPRPQHCFMAERELNLPPYSLLHPVFLKSVLSDRTFRMISRIRGVPRVLDPHKTFADWEESRQGDTADNGLSARISVKNPSSTVAHKSLLALQHPTQASNNNDYDTVNSNNNKAAAPQSERHDDEEESSSDDDDDDPATGSCSEYFPGYLSDRD